MSERVQVNEPVQSGENPTERIALDLDQWTESFQASDPTEALELVKALLAFARELEDERNEIIAELQKLEGPTSWCFWCGLPSPKESKSDHLAVCRNHPLRQERDEASARARNAEKERDALAARLAENVLYKDDVAAIGREAADRLHGRQDPFDDDRPRVSCGDCGAALQRVDDRCPNGCDG